ncbi:hypothetical protein [Metabacillus arenae]|uniref:Uncharacterized protein n=1 Tax=Metabacillus arenae TaxID=2771434 RepID=A0A926NM49_9BACI|nr:hypothetical protein [Metabacillus arenae]MBD1380346.1 hypothetical protein [Metabacillus arenae]
MNENKQFPVADLTNEHLQELQKMEQKLRQDTGEDIVLIAYEHGKKEFNAENFR